MGATTRAGTAGAIAAATTISSQATAATAVSRAVVTVLAGTLPSISSIARWTRSMLPGASGRRSCWPSPVVALNSAWPSIPSFRFSAASER
jgi:hypothetical protein